jgi:hypothetical protein
MSARPLLALNKIKIGIKEMGKKEDVQTELCLFTSDLELLHLIYEFSDTYYRIIG